MQRGLSAESPSVWRSRFMTALILCSNATMVSFASYLRLSSQLTTSLLCSSNGQDSKGLLRQADRFGPVLA